MFDFLFWILLAVIYLISIFVAAGLFDKHGQSVAIGVLLALILGPIAVIIGLFVPYDHEELAQRKLRHEELLIRSGLSRRCPHCTALIPSAATTCPGCGNQVEPTVHLPEPKTGASAWPTIWFILFLLGAFGQVLAKEETLALVAGLVAIAAFVAMMISALRDPAGPVSS